MESVQSAWLYILSTVGPTEKFKKNGVTVLMGKKRLIYMERHWQENYVLLFTNKEIKIC